MSRKQDKNALKNNVCAEVMLALVLKKRIWRWASLGLLCFGYLLLQTCSGDQTKAWNVPHIAQVAIEGPIQSVSQDWYQQLLKLGVPEGVPDISKFYVVWDSDLVPLRPWDLFVRDTKSGEPLPCVAILQNTSKAPFIF